jgi:hypothetical protein
MSLRIFDPIGWERKRRELDELRSQMGDLLVRERELDREFSTFSKRLPNRTSTQRKVARKAVAR